MKQSEPSHLWTGAPKDLPRMLTRQLACLQLGSWAISRSRELQHHERRPLADVHPYKPPVGGLVSILNITVKRRRSQSIGRRVFHRRRSFGALVLSPCPIQTVGIGIGPTHLWAMGTCGTWALTQAVGPAWAKYEFRVRQVTRLFHSTQPDRVGELGGSGISMFSQSHLLRDLRRTWGQRFQHLPAVYINVLCQSLQP